MPKLNVQQNNANVIKALRNALAIGQIKGPIASDGNDNFTSTGSNRNLLDNAYFVGGGSQLGDGIFPINQRGQTSYSNSSYGIDRWVGNYTLNAGYLTVNGFMYQIASYPLGVPLTFSAMLEDGSVVGGTLTITETTTQEYFYTDGSTIQLVKASGGGALMVWTGSSVNVKAVKLELGTVSTLANDVPPDFGEELLKCQRYFVRLKADIIYQSFGLGITDSADGTSASYTVPIPLPTALRASTTNVTFSNIAGFDGTGFRTINSILLVRISGTVPVATVVFSLSGSFTNGQSVLLLANQAGAYIDISAEL